jgi:SAM-dependent methyltransferase
MSRWSTLEIVQGYYVSELVWMLHRRAVWTQLENWQPVEEIAKRHRWDPKLLGTVLEYLLKTTDLLQKDNASRYKISRQYTSYSQLGFYLDFYCGAYGSAVNRACDALRHPNRRSELSSQRLLAQAFDGIGDAAVDESALEIMLALGVKRVLDLGCGSGALLCALARRDPSFLGWGIERSTDMCRIARNRLRQAQAGRRVKVVHGDVRRTAALLPAKQREVIELIYAGSLFNEFFREGTAHAASLLVQLAKIFPRRVLLVSDYYGRVHDSPAGVEDFRLTFLHDIAQALSGQGVPPGSVLEWEAIYRSAGLRLIRAYNNSSRGLASFHHVIQL